MDKTGPIFETPVGPVVVPPGTHVGPYVCPKCHAEYNPPKAGFYLCTQGHVASIWADGQRRNFVIERSESDGLPWAIPDVVEEKEISQGDLIEDQLYACTHPGDRAYGDLMKHLFGARHLSREEVLTKYAEYVLQPLAVRPASQGETPVAEPSAVESHLGSRSEGDLERKRIILVTALTVSLVVIVVAVLRLLSLL